MGRTPAVWVSSKPLSISHLPRRTGALVHCARECAGSHRVDRVVLLAHGVEGRVGQVVVNGQNAQRVAGEAASPGARVEDRVEAESHGWVGA